jgi:hypothetical protein
VVAGVGLDPGNGDGEPIVLATFADTENNQVMLTQWVGYQ